MNDETNKLVIMFCNFPEVQIREIPKCVTDVEGYIRDYLRYDVDKLSWQIYDNEEVSVKIC